MASGGDKFSPAFRGEWFDDTIIVSEDRKEDTRVFDNKVSITEKTRSKKIYTEKKITTSEDILKSATGAATRKNFFNSKVLKTSWIVESAGSDYWYSKRLQSVSIAFTAEGIALVKATLEENEETWIVAKELVVVKKNATQKT